MGTLRAIKIVWRRQFESLRPFERELAGIQRYEPVSRTSGGLVHVLHVGRNDTEGYFYYVMELADAVENPKSEIRNPKEVRNPSAETPSKNQELRAADFGVLSAFDLRSSDLYEPRTLRSDLRRLGRLPTADCLRLAIDVASGLSQLHRQGLVHRDVKPGNIIYVNGRAKLADIGLVTAEGEGRTFVGTEGYIPPEGPGSPAADLFALGVVLYEASTGFSPDRLPDAPPEWFSDPGGDEALEFHEVILKACEGQRERRYAEVEAMQADLALLQSGQSLRRVRALERRYAHLRISGVIGTTLLVLALVAAFFANYRARLAAENRAREIALRERAQASQARAESAERDARQQLYTALLEQARALVRSSELGQRVRALDALRRAATITNTADLRGAALAAMALPDLRFERQLSKAADNTMLRLDPRFERVALARGTGPVEIRSVADGGLLASLPASTNLSAFVAHWSNDGRFLAVKRDRTGPGDLADVEVWKVSQSRRVLLLENVDYGLAAFHPHRAQMLAALHKGEVALWDLEGTNELARFKLPAPPMLMAFSPDGERFAAAYRAEAAWTLSVFQSTNGAMLTSHAFTEFVASMDWHPGGRWIATADYGGAVQLIDAGTGESRTLGNHKVQAVLTACSEDGDYLLSGGWEWELICWDLRRMERAFTIGLNSFTAQFRSDGRECAIDTDEGVQLHEFEQPAGRREFAEDLGPRLRHAAFSADGHWLVASASQRLGVWDLTNATPGFTAIEGADARLFFSRGGELFASSDDACSRWQVQPADDSALAPRLVHVAFPKPDGFSSLCLGSNQVFVTGSAGTSALPLNEPGPVKWHWISTVQGISGASPDGRWLAIFRPYTRLLHIYELPHFNPVATLTNRTIIASFEFSPRVDEVAVSTPKEVEIWDTSNWQRTRELTNFVRLSYTPNDRTLWLTKDYQSAGLYDARTLQLLLPLPVGTLPMAVSPDGRRLAVSVDSRRLQVWDLAEVRTILHGLGLDW
jgi:WD40 repeat protein